MKTNLLTNLFIIFILMIIFSSRGFGSIGIKIDNTANRYGKFYAVNQQGEEVWESDTLMVNGKVYYKNKLGLKSPGAAAFLALVPGAIVRGVGHFYAGYPGTGAILLALDVVGIGGLIYVMGAGLASIDNHDAYDENEEEYNVIGLLSFGLFVGTWVYDIIGAPLKIRKNNRKIIENLSISMYSRNSIHSKNIGLQISYHF